MSASLQHFVNDFLNISRRGAMIHNANPQSKPAADCSVREIHSATTLDELKNSQVQFIELRIAQVSRAWNVTETDGAKRNGCQQFQFCICIDQRCEMARAFQIILDLLP